jgi:hypothetical protein
MKIALLGATQSGKTVYFSALSYQFRHSVAFIPLSPVQLDAYAQLGVSRRVGFRMSITSAKLEENLSHNAKLFSQRPIVKWPEPTEDLDQSHVDIHFKFCDVEFAGLREIETHRRTIEIYDPTGGALSGDHIDSEEIVGKLATCDIAIAFLPADIIAQCVEDDDMTALQNYLLMGKIFDIVIETHKHLDSEDILPLCFVISKSDVFLNRHENFSNDCLNTLYNQLIIPLSVEYKNIMLCVCPTSILDTETGNFRATNLEWPFLFAAGGTIFRNSVVLRDEADAACSSAQEWEKSATTLEQSGFWNWNRFKNWMDGNGVNARRLRAASYRNASGRLIEEADDDRELAKSAWSSLAIEGQARGVRIFMGGEEIDPRMVTDRL